MRTKALAKGISCAGVLLVMAACSSSGQAPAPREPADAAPTEQVTVSTEPETTEPEPTATITPTAASEPTEPSEHDTLDEASSDVPRIQPGVPLGLDGFFRPGENWDEKVYNVADLDSVQGITTSVERCGLDRAQVLELRTQNDFETLSFSVGQANESESSSERLLVEVIGDNGPPLHAARVGWNEIVPFSELPIDAVGAVKIRVALDDEVERCGWESVIAVFFDVTLS